MIVNNPHFEASMERLNRCFSPLESNWNLFYPPKRERKNLATRYHLVYPALAYFVLLRQQSSSTDLLQDKLNTIYRGLIHPRTWSYWTTEIEETSWPLERGNLTYAGRLATFLGFYYSSFGEFPSDTIALDGRSFTYSELSDNLWQQMLKSPSKGVTCFDQKAMVPCNAHLMINNLLHDRLFDTTYAQDNVAWLNTLTKHLLRNDKSGPLFFYGTYPNSCHPREESLSLGMDAWSLFLMSPIVPNLAKQWLEIWKDNITFVDNRAYINIPLKEEQSETSTTQLATAWIFCLAKELGDYELSQKLRHSLTNEALVGFQLDPLLSGLFTLGDLLEEGTFYDMVHYENKISCK